jgi:hypothetical protein
MADDGTNFAVGAGHLSGDVSSNHGSSLVSVDGSNFITTCAVKPATAEGDLKKYCVQTAIVIVAALALHSVLTTDRLEKYEALKETAQLMSYVCTFHACGCSFVTVAKGIHWKVGDGRSNQVEPRESFGDPLEPDFLVWSMCLTLKQKFFFFSLGLPISVVEYAIGALRDSTAGVVDLSFFWFPTPFMAHAQLQLFVNSARVGGRRLTLSANYLDAYMSWVKNSGLNFLSLGLWRFMKQAAARRAWVDSHIRFVGQPPDGFSNQFYYKQAEAPVLKKLCLAVGSVLSLGVLTPVLWL